MIIVMAGATEGQVQAVVERIHKAGLHTHVSVGVARTVIGVVGDDRTKEMLRESLEVAPGVEKVVAILQPYKLVSREFIPHDTVVTVGGRAIGGTQGGDASVRIVTGGFVDHRRVGDLAVRPLPHVVVS